MATVVHVVNRRNQTRIITITDEAAHASENAISDSINADGTRTFPVVDVAPNGIGKTTMVL